MTEGDRSWEVAEQFEDLGKQEYTARLGMWIFVGSEALLFAGLFGLYTAYRTLHSAAFAQASHQSDALLGTANTLVLITSSFTVAWAVHSIRKGRPRAAVLSLGITLALAVAFLVIKGVEYSHHFASGIYPGAYYSSHELTGSGPKLFFTLYYFMTGLHALHVIAGMMVLAWIAVLTLRGRFSAHRYAAVENGALYWHLVDLIWIFLWPLFYLIR
jgi:cytochrome c oxidase subunit III